MLGISLSEAKILAIFATVAVAVLGLTIYAGIEEHKRWEAFIAANECRVVGYISASTGTGIGVGVGITGSGQLGTMVMATTTPEKTGYLCKDGVTYWR